MGVFHPLVRFVRGVMNKPLQPIPNGLSGYSLTVIANPTVRGRDRNVVEYKQDLIGKSRYQEQLEEDILFTSPNKLEPELTQPDPFVVDESTVRYWSDYNRVDYHPRSIQRLPDLPDWDLGIGDWAAGKETFDKCNNQVGRSLGCVVLTSYPSFQDGYSLMDDSVRLFVEECDSLQVLLLHFLFEFVPSIYSKEPGVTNIYGSGHIRVVLPLFPFCLQG